MKENPELTYDCLNQALQTCMRGRSDVARRVRHAMTPTDNIPWQYQIDFSLDVPKVLETGQVVNHLSGRCCGLADDLEDYLQKRFRIPTTLVTSKHRRLHTFLTADTVDRGELVLDPGLGMFVEYCRIFLGTKAELKQVFMDESNRWLCGDGEFWTGDSSERTEELFELIYDYEVK
jgi:hypothetical protein